MNCPIYFSPQEEKDLIRYLDTELELYFVIEVSGQVVGFGGINFEDQQSLAKISWDIIHTQHQGKALGSALLNHRLQLLRNVPTLKRVIVRTSQMAYAFYKKNGFTLIETVNNYWAPGFHLYKMEHTWI